MQYKQFIQDNFKVIDKDTQQTVPFVLNKIQQMYLTVDRTWSDIILKARQQGFSSLIIAIFTADFIMEANSSSVLLANNDENAKNFLQKAKLYLKSYEQKNNIKIPLKYNSKTEMFNPFMNSTLKIGTAKNTQSFRSQTLTNLLCSEVAFYPNVQAIIASAAQAVVANGKAIFETTANGFNDFKGFWDAAKEGKNNFKPLFYRASDFYGKAFLDRKRADLDRLFSQEYPETDMEAFLTSGASYFNVEEIKKQYARAKDQYPVMDTGNLIYA